MKRIETYFCLGGNMVYEEDGDVLYFPFRSPIACYCHDRVCCLTLSGRREVMVEVRLCTPEIT